MRACSARSECVRVLPLSVGSAGPNRTSRNENSSKSLFETQLNPSRQWPVKQLSTEPVTLFITHSDIMCSKRTEIAPQCPEPTWKCGTTEDRPKLNEPASSSEGTIDLKERFSGRDQALEGEGNGGFGRGSVCIT